ncbi:response regulator transcription factor [Thioclava atlantica]|uniref:response regulator transcription factor n=1 Tax=Thioclava atlantica TaxID=1317124 RepID=UPI001EE25067|nr:response regulator transcription factor [Thioclava atlantica]
MNAIHNTVASERVGTAVHRDDSVIGFLGAAQAFSDTVLRTVEAEVPPSACHRFTDFDDLEDMLNADAEFPEGGTLRTLIVDERHAEALISLLGSKSSPLTRVKPIIAFEEQGYGQHLMDMYGPQLISRQISLLPMNVNLTTWLLILRMVVSGGHYIPPTLVRCRPSDPPRSALIPAETDSEAAANSGLTPREAEVLGMLSSGQANKIIASRLNLSEHTVKLHIHRIIGKLGVTNRTEAAIWYHRHAGC